MPWWTPKTWLTGPANKATATDFNRHVRDNINYLYRTQARKTATEQVPSSTTLQDDNDLVLPIGASETWLYEFNLPFISGTTPDIKFAIAVPSGATGMWGGVGPDPVTAGAMKSAALSAFGDANVITFGGTGVDSFIRLAATVVNGANPGNVQLRWAQNTSDATAAQIYANALMIGHRVSV